MIGGVRGKRAEAVNVRPVPVLSPLHVTLRTFLPGSKVFTDQTALIKLPPAWLVAATCLDTSGDE